MVVVVMVTVVATMVNCCDNGICLGGRVEDRVCQHVVPSLRKGSGSSLNGCVATVVGCWGSDSGDRYLRRLVLQSMRHSRGMCSSAHG